MNRRNYLAVISTLGTAAIAGCSEEGDGNSEPSEYEIELQSSSDDMNDSDTVENGEFQTYTLSVPVTTQFSISLDVTSGPPVDFFTMNQNEFNRYRDGEEFNMFAEHSENSVSSYENDGELASGDYRFVIDRTDVEIK